MTRKEPGRILPPEAHMLINEHFGPPDEDGAERHVIYRQIELGDIRHLTYAVINEETGNELPENMLTLGVRFPFDAHPDEMRQLLQAIDDIRSQFTALRFDILRAEVVSNMYDIDFYKYVPVIEFNKTIMQLLDTFRADDE